MFDRPFAFILAMCAALFLVGCDQSHSFRYRITVEVETPQGLRTGSAVQEIEAHRNTWFVNSAVRGRSLRGEAVAVDLPGGRTLFALLIPEEGRFRPEGLMDIVLRALDPTYGVGTNTDYVSTVTAISDGRGTRQPVVIDPSMSNPFATPGSPDQRAQISNYPLLVTFRNPRDPSSVLRVEPGELAAQFGDGVRLRRITVQVTDNSVTERIDGRLDEAFWRRWSLRSSAARENDAMNNPYFQSLAGQLSRDDFVKGEHR